MQLHKHKVDTLKRIRAIQLDPARLAYPRVHRPRVRPIWYAATRRRAQHAIQLELLRREPVLDAGSAGVPLGPKVEMDCTVQAQVEDPHHLRGARLPILIRAEEVEHIRPLEVSQVDKPIRPVKMAAAPGVGEDTASIGRPDVALTSMGNGAWTDERQSGSERWPGSRWHVLK